MKKEGRRLKSLLLPGQKRGGRQWGVGGCWGGGGGWGVGGGGSYNAWAASYPRRWMVFPKSGNIQASVWSASPGS